jgi:heat shock protein HslJ
MKRLFILTGTLMMLLFAACQEDSEYVQPTTALDGTSWHVVGMVKPLPEGNYLQAPAPYRLHFASDTTYHLALDVNNCSGHWEKGLTGNRIEMGPAGCTLICCDTDFAEYLAAALRNVNSYTTHAGNLVLRGAHGLKIQLEKASDDKNR